jgi:hypothetical protein
VALTIVAGLASRAVPLPWWLAKNAGDALYATMIYFAVGFALPRASTVRVAIAALAWCFAVEGLQAVHVGWLDRVRATLPGRLVLGQGFHAFDLVCYVVGVALAIGCAFGILDGRNHPSATAASGANRNTGQT